MSTFQYWTGIACCLSFFSMHAQEAAVQDSLYIEELEQPNKPSKVFHAEPLYIDLIRDLGARKGEREWNVGLGLQDHRRYDSYEALIEYEWAPMDRLGLEVELPFTFYPQWRGTEMDSLPPHQLNSLKLAAQWSFLVHEPASLSMALGYIHEFELQPSSSALSHEYAGNLFNPFLVVAKRWTNNWHSLLYTGPRFYQHFGSDGLQMGYETHLNWHYMISGTRNFIGLECNNYLEEGNWNATLRPQMRLSISDNLLIGIVGGIPLQRSQDGLSSFVRLIWEPGHRHRAVGAHSPSLH